MRIARLYYNQTIFIAITPAHSYQKTNGDTDHALVFKKVKLKAKNFHRSKQPGIPWIQNLCNNLIMPCLKDSESSLAEE